MRIPSPCNKRYTPNNWLGGCRKAWNQISVPPASTFATSFALALHTGRSFSATCLRWTNCKTQLALDGPIVKRNLP